MMEAKGRVVSDRNPPRSADLEVVLRSATAEMVCYDGDGMV